jgi:transposase-like protein
MNDDKIPERCPNCGGSKFVRRGRRARRFGSVQLWRCKSCRRTFTADLMRGKSYPRRAILDALCWYHQGYTVNETIRRVSRRYGLTPSENTVWKWVREYRDLCTYQRLRKPLRNLFRPEQIAKSVKLYHRQVYEYSIHRGKIATLLAPQAQHARFAPIGEYLERMLKNCPHELFRDESDNGRASQLGKTGKEFDRSQLAVVGKENHATETAALVLSTVSNNRLRHEALQRFLLRCDSVTVATEVPIYITPDDLAFMKASGFSIPIEPSGPITGHIDFLQIRNGAVHILDYKPDARTNRPIEQLTLYALALARQTGLRLFDFRCAWFNHEGYFEFYPLHVVHKLPRAVAL